jgi:hypothetical protein
VCERKVETAKMEKQYESYQFIRERERKTERGIQQEGFRESYM